MSNITSFDAGSIDLDAPVPYWPHPDDRPVPYVLVAPTGSPAW